MIAIASALLAATVTTTAAAGTESDFQVAIEGAESLDPGIREFAEFYGKKPAVAEQAIADGELAGILRTVWEIDDSFGGMWIEYGRGSDETWIHARFTVRRETSEVLRRAAEAVPPLANEILALKGQLTVHQSTDSLQDLKRVAELYRAEIDGVTGTGIDEPGHRVWVYADEGNLDAVRLSVAAAATSLKAWEGSANSSNLLEAETVRRVSLSASVLQNKLVPTSSTQVWAGDSLSPTCTAGFNVESGGTFGFMTAGHCGNTRYIDGHLAPLLGEAKSGSTWRTDAQWHSTPAALLPTNKARTSSSTVSITGLRAEYQQLTGQWVCKYGSSTGYKCAIIADVNFVITGYTDDFIRATNPYGQTIALTGDSGGPVFLSSNAYGVQSSSWGVDSMIYAPIDTAISRLGVNLLTYQPSSNPYDQLLKNTGFSGTAYWNLRAASGGSANWAVYGSPAFLEYNCANTVSGCSVYQDVGNPAGTVNDFNSGRKFLADGSFRCNAGSTCLVTLALWGFSGGLSYLEAVTTATLPIGIWTPVAAQATLDRNYSTMRRELYNGTVASNVNIQGPGLERVD